jgi:hypothetical protein
MNIFPEMMKIDLYYSAYLHVYEEKRIDNIFHTMYDVVSQSVLVAPDERRYRLTR